MPARVRLSRFGSEYTTDDVPLNRHQKQDGTWEPMLCWAAAELYNTTGETQYNDYLLEHGRRFATGDSETFVTGRT